MSTTPSELPGPPPGTAPAVPAGTPTHIAGQEFAPTRPVPLGPPGPSYTPAAGSQTNSLAVVSLVAGIGSFFAHIVPGVGGFTVALIAVITGYTARKQIRQSGEPGMGMATAGMVIGAIHIGLLVLLVLGVLFLIFVLGVAMFGVHHSTQ